jgi:hypothetical protein
MPVAMTFFILVLTLNLIPLNGLALWAFLRFQPECGHPRAAGIFNLVTFFIAPVLCAVFSLWLNTRLHGNVDGQWLAFLSALGWPAAFPVVLVIAGLLRNFLVFRNRSLRAE